MLVTYVCNAFLVIIVCKYVTGPEKTGLIYTKCTCSYCGTYLLFCMCYQTSVSFIEFLMDFCISDNILDTIKITDKMLLYFKLSKTGQILHVDKTSFLRFSHIYKFCKLHWIPHCLLYWSVGKVSNLNDLLSLVMSHLWLSLQKHDISAHKIWLNFWNLIYHNFRPVARPPSQRKAGSTMAIL